MELRPWESCSRFLTCPARLARRTAPRAFFSLFLPAALLVLSCNVSDHGDGGEDAAPMGPLDVNVPPITSGNWYRPAVDTTWQWQLQPDAQGNINTTYDVEVYDIDLFEAPDTVIRGLHDAGRMVICYFSAGSIENFREDVGEFREEETGNLLEGYPDERWVDIRSANVRRIMLARLDLAVARGCDGVEPDNVTAFLNDTGFDLSPEDQLAYNRCLANEAHQRGLAVALKNDLEQIPDLVEYFDFAVNEECHEFDECAALSAFIAAGKPVFNAEYADEFVEGPAGREALCEEARAHDFRTLILPVDLDDSFRFSCDR